MPICYLCGEEMIDEQHYLDNIDSFISKPKFKHFEHIINNSLYGRLKSNIILCKDCGGKFSQDIDKDFVSLFHPITERIKDILIKKDHGKDSSNTLKGYLFEDEKLAQKKEVLIRDNEVSPKNPYYEVDVEKKSVWIYGNKIRAQQYLPIVKKELIQEGLNIEELSFNIQSDITDKGILSVFFTESVENFNDKFRMGFVKIAVNFASYCGINRNSIPRALSIADDNQGEIVYTKNLIPFVPIGAVDLMIEFNRPEIEDYYPTHTLILFTKIVDNKKHLYCYVDLFSTFQYYVLLNENYLGDEIYENYHQSLTKQELPYIDVRKVRPKYLNIIIDEYGIDRSKYKGSDHNDFLNFLDNEIKNYRFNPKLELSEELKKILSRLSFNYALYKSGNLQNNTIADNFKNLGERQVPAFLMEMHEYFHITDNGEELVNPKSFRITFFEDDGDQNFEILSTPIECMHELTDEEMRKFYGHLKFGQIEKFVNDSKVR